MSHLPVHDILVLITVGACMVLIAIWASVDAACLVAAHRRGEI